MSSKVLYTTYIVKKKSSEPRLFVNESIEITPKGEMYIARIMNENELSLRSKLWTALTLSTLINFNIIEKIK